MVSIRSVCPSWRNRSRETRSVLIRGMSARNLGSSSAEMLIKFWTNMCKHASGGRVCGFVIRASFSTRPAVVIHLTSRWFFIIASASSLALLLKMHARRLCVARIRFAALLNARS